MTTHKYSVEVTSTGTSWYREGTPILHRLDGPAVENLDGTKYWCKEGQLHREDGAAIEWRDGRKEWYLNGKLHRVDGAAIEWSNGTKEWWLNGQLHREDGAAIEWSNGTKEWWLNGILMPQAEHTRLTSPVEEMTMAQVEAALGKRIKIIK